ncbi:MAG: short-chain dehydrogenase/reductase, partial [Chitinophagaceae bacterium]|nr:short-chain dehydrogenase/reductase [Chitinophagaceae bacterium]
MEKVWFITGCSTGFGRELATYVLSKGYKAAVAARHTEDVKDIVAKGGDRALAVQLDVTKSEDIKNAVRQVKEKFGR